MVLSPLFPLRNISNTFSKKEMKALLFCFLHFQIIWSFFRNSNNGKVSKDYDNTFFSQPCWFVVSSQVHGKALKPFMHLKMHGEIQHYTCSDIDYLQNRDTCKACAYFFCAVRQQRSICWVGVSVILNFHCSLRTYVKQIKEEVCFNQN